MLVLSRKIGERIRIAGNIEVVVTDIQGDKIKIGIEAPKDTRILRRELVSVQGAASARTV
jgi:carbon storage regulator